MPAARSFPTSLLLVSIYSADLELRFGSVILVLVSRNPGGLAPAWPGGLSIRPLLDLWAKLGTGYPAEYHPVVCHLLDVAHVTLSLWEQVLPLPLKERMARALRLPPDTAGRWVAFWAGSHDLGKVSPGFQAKSDEAKEALKRLGLQFPVQPKPAPHGTVSAAVLGALLSSSTGWPAIPRSFASRLAVAVGGHHGVFPRAEQTALTSSDLGRESWGQLRSEVLGCLAQALGVNELPAPDPKEETDHFFFIALAGLTSVADWVGSSQDHFPFAGGQVDLPAYTCLSRSRALAALGTLGWTGWDPSAAAMTFADLFGFTARPLQQQAEQEASRLTGPGLVLVEAPMGEGKTEAALFLSDYWSHALGQRGLYVALPTQATSNQMFSRVRAYLEHRYPRDRVNLHLLHGHALLSDEYQQLRLAAVYDEDSSTGRVVAEGWFTPKKRGLLAPFAVGTIDQVLLAVLQTRHSFVRLFGLAGKTVVLDEVHAYDVYMSTLMERLLAWLSALGCSVVLLSATLPRARRRQLLAAFGAGVETAPDVPYPRLLSVQGGEVASRSFPPARTTDLLLRRVERSRLADSLVEALGEGGCAALVCNTVRTAQEMYRSLKTPLGKAGIVVRLFHARFPFGRRDALEKQALRDFGKGGTRPQAALLIATQVIEQSLDLDFDLMVTELAPIDLLLQRAGRLHRHAGRTRPTALQLPQLWVVSEEGEEGGSVPCFGGSEKVYDRYVLLRSRLALQGRDGVSLPDDLEPLIEQVYGDFPLPVPDAQWQAELDRSLGALEEKRAEHRGHALRLLVKPPDYDDDILQDFCQQLEEDDPQVHPTLQALTRLGEPSVTVVCLYRTPTGYSLDREGRRQVDLSAEPSLAEAKELLKAAVSLTHPSLVRHFVALGPPSGWRRSPLLRHHRVAEFGPDGTLRVGIFLVELDDDLGLVISRPEGGGD